MAPNRLYANYPGAKKAANTEYRWEEPKNPALRGLPLVAAVTM